MTIIPLYKKKWGQCDVRKDVRGIGSQLKRKDPGTMWETWKKDIDLK